MNAKQLFEQLGYSIHHGNAIDELIYVKKNANSNEAFDYQIIFLLKDNKFKIQDDWGDSYAVGVDVLTAIMFQLKELGWIQ